MQIHEITKKQTNEGIMDTLKGVFKTDPASANLPLDQRIRAAQTNTATQQVAKLVMQQWQNKMVQLTRAASTTGGAVSDQEYGEQLEDFIERVLLQNKRVEDLDQQSGQRLDAIMQKIVAGRNDAKALPELFNNLTAVTTAARVDTTKFKGGQTQQPTAQQGAQNLSQANPQVAVKQALKGVNTSALNQQIAAVGGGPQTVKSTSNRYVDQLLKQLGIQVV